MLVLESNSKVISEVLILEVEVILVTPFILDAASSSGEEI